jgi:Rrf2 family iron-sulfur cluster assembly transcriptional regulator
MRINTKGRFAVTGMIDLAMRSDHGPVPLAAIGKRQQISLSYLEQLFGKLRRADLVKSIRGPGGGYALARGMVDISVADIVAAVDETGPNGHASAAEADAPGGNRLTHALWAGLDAEMFSYLASVSLEDLVADQIARGVTAVHAPAGQGVWKVAVVKPISRIPVPNSVFALGAAMALETVDGGTL